MSAGPPPHPLLPLRARALADEAFSCWIVRLAAAYGLKARSLCNLLTGKRIEFTTDYDTAPDSDLIQALADRTGTEAEAIRTSHTLGGLFGRTSSRAYQGYGNPWVLPFGSFYDLRPGMQYCPLCLREPLAYYRRTWRLSLLATCPRHGVSLRHVCPSCSLPTHPIKNDLRWGGGTITRCWNCGYDLCGSAAEPVEQEDAWLACELVGVLHLGAMPAGYPPCVDGNAYLAGLALVCSKLLGQHPRLRSWHGVAAKRAGGMILPTQAGRRISTNFSSLADPSQRRTVLRVATYLLLDWPERFLEVARASGARTSDFAGHFAAAPAWFLEPLQARLTPPRQKPVPSSGLLKVCQMREFMLEHRREWGPSKLPRLIRALRANGFYSAQTDDHVIMRSLPNTIARLRAEGSDYRQRLTRQVERGTRDWSNLLLLAKPYRKTHCKNPEILRRGIKLLCADYFLSSADLGELLHRNHSALRVYHLTPMVQSGELRTRFGRNKGGSFSYPGQAYRVASGT